jgi:hypothetical protein
VTFDDGLDAGSIDERISEINDALVTTEPQIRSVYLEPTA